MTSSALVSALSGFWHQFFKDLPDIDAMYQGAEHLAGQYYLDTLNAVLGLSVKEATLLRQQDCALLTVGTSEITRNPNMLVNGYLVPNAVKAARIGYLQDALLSPTAILDARADFEIQGSSIWLSRDPRQTFNSSAKRASGVAVSAVIQSDGASDVVAGDELIINGKNYVVAYANNHELGLRTGYSFATTEQTVTWSRYGSGNTYTSRLVVPANGIGYEDRYALWAVDNRIDDYTLFNNFGYLLKDSGFAPPAPTPSTERYRTFLTGIYRLLYGGPTEEKVEAAINVVAGLPLVSSDGETVLSVESERVVTDRRVYDLPAGVPKRDDVVVGKTLRAFRPLVKIVHFYDNTNHPYWWYRKTVPQQFLPQMSEAARYVTAELHPNWVGAAGSPTYPVVNVIGNVDLKVGVSKVEKASYFAMSTILKHHLFGVKLHPYIDTVDGALDRVRNLLMDVRPSHKYPYIWVE